MYIPYCHLVSLICIVQLFVSLSVHTRLCVLGSRNAVVTLVSSNARPRENRVFLKTRTVCNQSKGHNDSPALILFALGPCATGCPVCNLQTMLTVRSKYERAAMDLVGRRIDRTTNMRSSASFRLAVGLPLLLC